jgi:signal transduction histidine kinase
VTVSVSFRLLIALFGAAVVAVTLLVFSLLLYGLASGGLIATLDRDLTQRGERTLSALSVAGRDAFSSQRDVAPVDPGDSNDTFVALLDSSGQVLVSTATVNGAPLQFRGDVLASEEPRLVTDEVAPGLPLRLYVRPWQRQDLGLSGYLIVGQAVRGVQSTQAGIRGFLWLSGVLTFVAGLVAIWLVAGRALRPLRLVAMTAEDIRLTGDLRRRLPESRGWVELNQLARAFNGMLERLAQAQDRLANSLEAQRRFVADASHELRTPLTTIRSNAGLLLQRPDVAAEDRQSALGDIASEAERMSRLVHDLLTLARADAGQHLERGPLDLQPLVSEVGRQAQQVYSDRNVRVEVGPARVLGNADALKQLQWILLDNAARFAGPGGCIWLRVCSRDDQAELGVADSGPGVAPADRQRIFDRFFQADFARANGGVGLGLSIARWIVAEHAGTIAVDDNPEGRGASFVVKLPLASTV